MPVTAMDVRRFLPSALCALSAENRCILKRETGSESAMIMGYSHSEFSAVSARHRT